MIFADALIIATTKTVVARLSGDWKGVRFEDGSYLLQRVYINGDCSCESYAEMSICFIPVRCKRCFKCDDVYHELMAPLKCNICCRRCETCKRGFNGALPKWISILKEEV